MRRLASLFVLVAGLNGASAQAPGIRAISFADEQEAKPEKSEKKATTRATSGLRFEVGQRQGLANTRGGSLGYTSAPHIEVRQPRPDFLLITMTGAAAAAGLPSGSSLATINFELNQVLQVIDERPNLKGKGKPIRLVMDAQLVGLFRVNREGAGLAESASAEAVLSAGDSALAHVGFAGHAESKPGVVMISERSPASEAIIEAGQFNLNQRFALRCAHPKRCFHKNTVIAMFGPVGKAPEWLDLLDPTRNLPKGAEMGFRVAIRLMPVPEPRPLPIPAARPTVLAGKSK